MRLWKTGVAAVISCLGLAGAAQAVPLGLIEGLPDITSGFINTSYTPGGSDNFTASGYALTLDYDGLIPPDHNISDSMLFNITATIDNAGNASDGTLTITGSVPDLALTDQVLLSGSLSQFGFGGVNAPFEFVFNNLSGALASQFGSEAGVILSSTSTNFNGSFENPFSTDGFEVSDTFSVRHPVPEPLTASLGALALAGTGLAALRRRSC